jgi:hypothetical protein
MNKMTTLTFCRAIIVIILLASSLPVWAQKMHADKTLTTINIKEVIPVTWKNFTRAESDKMFKSFVDMGAFGKIVHVRKPTPIDKQNVIRMNRDTQYSFLILDLTSPATITKPDAGGRFQSMQVINEDQYTKLVAYKPGTYTITREQIGTRYVLVAFRTLVDAGDPDDIKKVIAMQDQIKVEQKSIGNFEIPNWDKTSQDKIRESLLVVANTMKNTNGCFGDENEVDPIKFLLGSAYGWGGNPAKDAMYAGVTPKKNDGKTPYKLTVKDVPVDGFWSISLYNGEGFFQENEYNAYSINNIMGEKNNDGSITIHFGGDPKKPNYLPIMDGWNYLIRLYRPHPELINGQWKFPEPQEAK